jgi:hypothetical protein
MKEKIGMAAKGQDNWSRRSNEMNEHIAIFLGIGGDEEGVKYIVQVYLNA